MINRLPTLQTSIISLHPAVGAHLPSVTCLPLKYIKHIVTSATQPTRLLIEKIRTCITVILPTCPPPQHPHPDPTLQLVMISLRTRDFANELSWALTGFRVVAAGAAVANGTTATTTNTTAGATLLAGSTQEVGAMPCSNALSAPVCTIIEQRLVGGSREE